MTILEAYPTPVIDRLEAYPTCCYRLGVISTGINLWIGGAVGRFNVMSRSVSPVLTGTIVEIRAEETELAPRGPRTINR